jgi:hypothetical protein
MRTLLSEIVPLGLVAGISPVIFLLQLATLTGQRPIARGSALTAGAATALIVVSTIGVLVAESGLSTRETLQVGMKIAFGALLVAVGAACAVETPEAQEP